MALRRKEEKVAIQISSSADPSSSKRPGEFFDPCQEAADRSLKCLHRNGGDRDMCTDYFQ
jgi:cytochrome c oxidase assembly protein subunit 23